MIDCFGFMRAGTRLKRRSRHGFFDTRPVLAPRPGPRPDDPTNGSAEQPPTREQPQAPLPGQITAVPCPAPRLLVVGARRRLRGRQPRDTATALPAGLSRAPARRLNHAGRPVSTSRISSMRFRTAPAVGPRSTRRASTLRSGSASETRTRFRVTAGLDIQRRTEDFLPCRCAGLVVAATRVSGMTVGADACVGRDQPGACVHAMVSHGTASSYTWGRVAAKRSSPTRLGRAAHFLRGAEGTGQGNEDIRSWQIGGLRRNRGPSEPSFSLMVRGGYKTSELRRRPFRDGRIFVIGIWKHSRPQQRHSSSAKDSTALTARSFGGGSSRRRATPT